MSDTSKTQNAINLAVREAIAQQMTWNQTQQGALRGLGDDIDRLERAILLLEKRIDALSRRSARRRAGRWIPFGGDR